MRRNRKIIDNDFPSYLSFNGCSAPRKRKRIPREVKEFKKACLEGKYSKPEYIPIPFGHPLERDFSAAVYAEKDGKYVFVGRYLERS